MSKVKISVVYCSGCGYASKYRQLKQTVEQKLDGLFPGTLEWSGTSTPGRNGFFEVTVGDRLVHSKKNGEGFVDSDAKYEKIVQAVKHALWT